MRVLALDSAVGRCSATLVVDDIVVTVYQQDIERGHAATLPIMARDCLRDWGADVACLDLVAVTIGPGSFTGIRGAVALAQGLSLSIDRPVVGVTVGEALADSLPQLGARRLWTATTSRRGRIFLEIDDHVLSLEASALPNPGVPVAVAGPAAAEVASLLAARGTDVMLTDARLPTGRHIARVAEQRFRGAMRPRPAEPLYVDPPAAKLPANIPLGNKRLFPA